MTTDLKFLSALMVGSLVWTSLFLDCHTFFPQGIHDLNEGFNKVLLSGTVLLRVRRPREARTSKRLIWHASCILKGRHVCKCQPLWLTSRAPKVWFSIPHGDLEVFLFPTLVTRQKSILLYFFTELKPYHLSYFIYTIFMYEHLIPSCYWVQSPS